MSAKSATQPAGPKGPGTLKQLRTAATDDTQGEAPTDGPDSPSAGVTPTGDVQDAVIVSEVLPATAPKSGLLAMAEEVAAGREVTPVGEGRELAERAHPAMTVLHEWISQRARPANEADWIMGDIVGQVLNATTPDEVLADPEILGLKQCLGRAFTLHKVDWQRSDFEQGHPFYAVMTVTFVDTGWTGLITSGANTIVAQVSKLVQLNALPVDLVCVEARKTPAASGHMPLKLVAYKPTNFAQARRTLFSGETMPPPDNQAQPDY